MMLIHAMQTSTMAFKIASLKILLNKCIEEMKTYVCQYTCGWANEPEDCCTEGCFMNELYNQSKKMMED